MAIDCLIIEEDQSVVDIIKKVGGDFDQIRFNHVEENHEKVLNTIIKIKPKIMIEF